MEEQEEIKKRTMTVVCSVCGERIPKAGTSFKEVDGKRIFTCPDCCENEPMGLVKHIKKSRPEDIRNVSPSRKTCFFCNGDTFHLNMDNSIQCSSCKSIFFKGPIK